MEILECLLAKIKVMQERIDSNLKRLDAKIEAKMHSHHEELKMIMKGGQG
jgi:hypothetical protein